MEVVPPCRRTVPVKRRFVRQPALKFGKFMGLAMSICSWLSLRRASPAVPIETFIRLGGSLIRFLTGLDAQPFERSAAEWMPNGAQTDSKAFTG